MIRFIAAMDEKQGLANDHGIPWWGKIPTDIKTFREKTQHSTVLMGYNTYKEFSKPLSDRENYVLTEDPAGLRPGWKAVTELNDIPKLADNLWIIGGPGVFAQTINMADELHLTHLTGDFHCTKFFPPYEDTFELVDKSEPIIESDITYYFATYRRKA